MPLTPTRKLRLQTARDVLTIIWRVGFVAPTEQTRFNRIGQDLLDKIANERRICHERTESHEG